MQEFKIPAEKQHIVTSVLKEQHQRKPPQNHCEVPKNSFLRVGLLPTTANSTPSQ
jgi:hypothetical protein